jgi:hypothetical protein
LGVCAGRAQHLEQSTLLTLLAGDTAAHDQRQCVVELFAAELYQQARNGDDVDEHRAGPDRVLGNEPDQIRPVKVLIVAIAFVVATSAQKCRVRLEVRAEGTEVAVVHQLDGSAKARVEEAMLDRQLAHSRVLPDRERTCYPRHHEAVTASTDLVVCPA